MTEQTLYRVGVRAVEHEAHLHPAIRVTDFAQHRDEIIWRVLPRLEGDGRLLVTWRGFPDFVIAPPGVSAWRKVSYHGTMLDEPAHPGRGVRYEWVDLPKGALEGRGPGWTETVPCVRVTSFWRHKSWIVAHDLPEMRGLMVTRYGWPIFRVKQYEGPSQPEIRFEPVVSDEEMRSRFEG